MNQNGRSMIEMLGVLAIIGVLSVGGIAGYSKAMLKYKTNKLIDQVTMLTTNIRTLYGQQKTFSGLDGRRVKDGALVSGYNVDTNEGASAIAMGVVPDDMIVSITDGSTTSQTIQNPFSGTYTLRIDSSIPNAAGYGRAFVIGINGIPKDACMAMATSDWGSNSSSGLIGMAIHNQGGPAADDLYSAINSKSATAYAGSDCGVSTTKGVLGTGTSVSASAAEGAICAAHMPLNVAAAAKACACQGSNCSVAIKYY